MISQDRLVVASASRLISAVQRDRSPSEEPRGRLPAMVELTDQTDDPATWGKNFPSQYNGYRRTVDQVRPGSAAAGPAAHADEADRARSCRLEEDPRLRTMSAGYAFSKDFREERGHAYVLDDQTYHGARSS